jgi:DNA polymerase III delta' subunit
MPLRDVIGHQALLGLVSRALARETLPQSLIFAGPDGVGKRLAAVAVAQVFNCQQLVRRGDEAELPLDACGTCPACRRVAQGLHPDVILLPGGIKVDDIRAAIESAGYRPFEGRHRVFILDDADRLSSEIQNALLKTLEEPPPSSSFILVTSRAELLLPTVRSRCPMLRFGRLPGADVEQMLRERHGFDAADARAAAIAGDGSIARALIEASEEGAAMRDLVEQVLHRVQTARSPADRLNAAVLLMEPGLPARAPAARASAASAKGGGDSGEMRPRTRSKPVTKAQSERDLLGQRLGALGAALRDLAALATGADASRLSSAASSALPALVKGFGAQRLIAAFDAVGKAREALEQNVNPKTIVDWLVFQI